MNIIGEVDGRTCVIMDDMVDTAGTLCKAAEVLKERGAEQCGGVLQPMLSCPATRCRAYHRFARSMNSSSPTPLRCGDDARARATRFGSFR